MKCIYLFVICSFLMGCSATPPSEAISNSSVSQLKTISSQIKEVASTSLAKCPEIASKLDLINSQIDGVKGQVENISLACQTEKKVLEEKITVRDVIISFMGLVIFYVLFLFFRSKIKIL